MSEPSNPSPGYGGPLSRPDGAGLPPKTGGPEPLGGGDSRAPGMEGEGRDLGEDSAGVTGEG
jgi:hypothetical protein